jgi:hypothetical protein
MPYTVQVVQKPFLGLLRVSRNHPVMNGFLTPFINKVMVSPYCTLSKWFLKTLPRTCKSFQEPPSDEWFPHTIHSPNGSRKPFPELLTVEGNHPAMNGSLTPFLDEAMVSSYHILSKWFPKTLPRTCQSFWEPPSDEWFPYTIL